MKVKERLTAFFEENGFQKSWFARRIGTSKAVIYGILGGRIQLPKKLWRNAVEMSRGYLKPEDILSDFLKDHLVDIPYIKLEEDIANKRWIITVDETPQQQP